MKTQAVNDWFPAGTCSTRRLVATVVAGILVLEAAMVAPVPARAGYTQFACFDMTAGTPFQFTCTSPCATLTATTGVSVHFVNMDSAPVGPQDATLRLLLSTTTPAQSLGSLLIQPIDTLSTLSLIRNSDHANLLTVAFTGVLSGTAGGNAMTLDASTPTGNTVVYTSDVIPGTILADMTGRSLQLSLQPVAPQIGKDPTTGFLTSFSAGGGGAFVGSPVPEPGSFVLLASGLVWSVFVALRHRKGFRASGPFAAP
jgi:hypothetical protein